MTLEDKIKEKLLTLFDFKQIRVINESDKHRGHKESGGDNSHFLIEVSEDFFVDKTKIEAHRIIYKALEKWINNPIHAVSIKKINL